MIDERDGWTWGGVRKRRSDEGRGFKGESERVTSDACGGVDDGEARVCGKRGKAFGDLGAPFSVPRNFLMDQDQLSIFFIELNERVTPTPIRINMR